MALRKVAQPEDIAAQVVALSSDVLSGHISGELVTVAGGWKAASSTTTRLPTS
jgi:3-oxoacyl-[acyl-carrier protein] reductase